MKPHFCIVLLSAAVLVTGCNDKGTYSEGTQMKAIEASQDSRQLAVLMQVPGNPASVRWAKIGPSKGSQLGPGDFSLLAVLDYGDTQLGELLKKLGAPSDNEPVAITEAEAKALFSDDVVKSFHKLNGNSLEVAGKLFSAEPFLKSPLLQGKVVVVAGTSLLLVSLFTA